MSNRAGTPDTRGVRRAPPIGHRRAPQFGLRSLHQRNDDQRVRTLRWNMRAAANVMELTSMVEVITRNALDAQLRDWARGSATEHPGSTRFPSMLKGSKTSDWHATGQHAKESAMSYTVASLQSSPSGSGGTWWNPVI